MDKLTLFLEQISNGQKLLWIFCNLLFFMLIENVLPMLREQKMTWKHSKTNLFLLLTTILINIVFGIVTAKIFLWQELNRYGVFNIFKINNKVELIISIMILDLLAQYFVHYLLHNVPLMWRFHTVHHSDTKVDVTTGTRHHPIDFIMRESFSLLAILVFGIPFPIYVLYRLLTIFFTYFSHANIKINQKFENLLSLIFITPSLHKFHHHHEAPWTDSNYGNMFSFWDRIFGTLVKGDSAKIVYGLDILPEEKSDDLGFQLRVPFSEKVKRKLVVKN